MRSPLLSEQDLRRFRAGTHTELHERLGAHPGRDAQGREGVRFAVWAPNARAVGVIGSFNGWDPAAHPLRACEVGEPAEPTGVFEGFVPGARRGDLYKYRLTAADGSERDLADPFATLHEAPPGTASVVWPPEHGWQDEGWLRARRDGPGATEAPISVYEVHLGSWRRVPEEDDRPLTYRELAPRLAAHVRALGFTHVGLMPICEHPFDRSWGYRATGYFAPTRRYGQPEELMALIDHLHQEGIGVFLDWVPSHFALAPHGLERFDGTPLFEDPEHGVGNEAPEGHPDARGHRFDLRRPEVRSFLRSSAAFWIERYHVDGLRVVGVTAMLGRQGWTEKSEARGGPREDETAAAFVRELGAWIHDEHPGVLTFAEETSGRPLMSRPPSEGGLGFDYEWDVGWSQDTLRYLERDLRERRYHHSEITFRSRYAFQERFVLPLSHDRVAHGRGSLLNRMPGDRWRKFANLRLLYGYMFSQPGKKLSFMGCELAQWREWSHETSLDWHLEHEEPHAAVARLLADLNRLYRREPALFAREGDAATFAWVDDGDAERSILSYLRLGRPADPPLLVVLNFTAAVHHDLEVGVPRPGPWEEILNTDAAEYGGSGVGNLGSRTAVATPRHGQPASILVNVPPLAAVWFRAAKGVEA